MPEHIEITSLKTATKGIEQDTRAILKKRNKKVKAERESHKDNDGKYTIKPQTLPRQIRYESLKIKSLRFVVKNVDKKFYDSKTNKLVEFIYAHVLKTELNGNCYHLSSFKDGSFAIDIPPYLANSAPVDEYITPISIGVINTGIKHLLKDTDYVPVAYDATLNKQFIETMLEHGDVNVVLDLLKIFKEQLPASEVKMNHSVISAWRSKILKRVRGKI